MKNSVQKGDSKSFTAGANLSSGDAVVIGILVGVVMDDVLSGAAGIAAIEQVYTLPKLSTAVIADGVALTWDISGGEIILGAGAAGDVVGFGVADGAAGNGTTTVNVKLCPGSGSIT